METYRVRTSTNPHNTNPRPIPAKSPNIPPHPLHRNPLVPKPKIQRLPPSLSNHIPRGQKTQDPKPVVHPHGNNTPRMRHERGHVPVRAKARVERPAVEVYHHGQPPSTLSHRRDDDVEGEAVLPAGDGLRGRVRKGRYLSQSPGVELAVPGPDRPCGTEAVLATRGQRIGYPQEDAQAPWTLWRGRVVPALVGALLQLYPRLHLVFTLASHEWWSPRKAGVPGEMPMSTVEMSRRGKEARLGMARTSPTYSPLHVVNQRHPHNPAPRPRQMQSG